MDMQQYHCELPRLTLCLEVRASCFNHHCLAGDLMVLSGLNDVYKRYIRLIPSLELTYVLFLGNKKAPIGAIHQFSNNDVEDDIAKTNVEPL